jgi:DNA helicase INO80
MPTLFDSHDEFNEWFSKDIENHATTQTALNERIQFLVHSLLFFNEFNYFIFLTPEDQLNRLHMILKPFMLRRVKREVENEMAPKIELEVIISLYVTLFPRSLPLFLFARLSFFGIFYL